MWAHRPGSLEGAACPRCPALAGVLWTCAPDSPPLSPTGPFCLFSRRCPALKVTRALGPGGDRSFWGGGGPQAGGPPRGPAPVCMWVMLLQGLGGDEINSDSLSAGGQAGPWAGRPDLAGDHRGDEAQHD